MIARLLDLDPYALFLAYVAVLGAVLTIAAVVDSTRKHRSAR